MGLPGVLEPEAWAAWYGILKAAAATCPASAAAAGGPWAPLHQMLAVACARWVQLSCLVPVPALQCHGGWCAACIPSVGLGSQAELLCSLL